MAKITLRLALAAGLAAPAPRQAASPQPALREAAGRIGLLVGAAADPAHFSEPEYAGTLAHEFNMIEPENAMKWTHTEPARGEFDFGPGDQVVSFAEAHHMKVRGHNLLWGIHNPAWLADGHSSAAELRDIMQRHVARVAGHYAGKVFAWDVVNEAFDKNGALAHSIWFDHPGIGLADKGTAYIEQAFRWAHEADPKALLFYNDYAAEGLNAKSDAIYAMVKDFKQRGVPIDGLGLQMHVSIADAANLSSTLDASISRLAALGVQVQITELDVGLPIAAGGQPRDPADAQRQADLYGLVARVCAANPGCTAFQTWGFTDKYSWIPNFSHGQRGAGLLFDAGYKPKLSYDAV
ncbi:MAG TPA: endo-1,4-beta-xylanase, partial [Terriglobia bacterium]|nr:endo-1,4-beta-xylanase [Terriglobia bacterium]